MKIRRTVGLISIVFIFITVLTLSLEGAFASWRQDETCWKQDSTGWWYDEGDSYCTGWNDIDGKRYYFDESGYMKTGWYLDGSTWYYLESNGAMKIGYLKDKGSWYYFDKNGAIKTGLVYDGLRWIRLEEDGQMNECSLKINGDTYYLKVDNESNCDDKTYYLISDKNILMKNAELGNITTNKDGKVLNAFDSFTELDGWENLNGKRYFYDFKTGIKSTGWVEMSGMRGNVKYYFDENGEMKTGWFLVDDKKYFAGEDGIVYTGIKEVEDKLYLFNESGELNTTHGIITHDGKTSYINEDETVETGWREIDNNKCYFDEDGYALSGIAKVKNEKTPYYFDCNTFGLVRDADYYGVVTNENGQAIEINDDKAQEDILANDSNRINRLKKEYGEIKINYNGIYSLGNIFKSKNDAVISNRFNKEDTSIEQEQVLHFDVSVNEEGSNNRKIDYFVSVKDGTILTSNVEDSFDVNLYQVKNNQILEEYNVN